MNKDIYSMVKAKLLMIWEIIFFLITFISINLTVGAIFNLFVNFFLLQQLVFFISILLATKLSMFIFEKKMVVDIGLRFNNRSLREIIIGLIIPFIILTSIFLTYIFLNFGHVVFITNNDVILNIILSVPYYILVGFNEEILFRGFIFQKLMEGTGKYFAVLFFSVLFGFSHYFNPHIDEFSTFNIVLAGILFSIAYIRTNSLWLPISMHFSWNFVEGMVYGFPVSGRISMQSYLMFNSTGPEWITGGYFGPEGGILTTFLLAIFSVFILLNKKLLRPTV
jgi:uncharacterized protein